MVEGEKCTTPCKKRMGNCRGGEMPSGIRPGEYAGGNVPIPAERRQCNSRIRLVDVDAQSS